MNTYTHQTAPTQFVEANGIRFAHRRFGKAAFTRSQDESKGRLTRAEPYVTRTPQWTTRLCHSPT
jgi:hypothetical protein